MQRFQRVEFLLLLGCEQRANLRVQLFHDRFGRKHRRWNVQLIAGLALLAIIVAFCVIYPVIYTGSITEPDFAPLPSSA